MNRRTAYTLLELLVVLAIILVLCAMLLSAVQKVRSAADRIKCAANMRSVALATVGYHDIHSRLPVSLQPNLVAGEYYKLSWLAKLLPWLEETNLWEQIESEYANNPIPFRNPLHGAIRHIVRQFQCPSDPVAKTPWRISWGGTHPTEVAFTSYLGNLGASYREQTGVIVQKPKVSMTTVTDGASQTLLLVERVPSRDRLFGWWYCAEGQRETGSLDFVMGVREMNGLTRKYAWYGDCPPGPFRFQPWDANDLCSVFSIGGNHPGTSNFAMLDGSARSLTYAADAILPALATRAGSEIVSAED